MSAPVSINDTTHSTVEIWREVDGLPYYSVSNHGNIFSHHSNRVLKKHINPRGYLCFHATQKLIHRAVASAFIPNPNNKPQVNHIDGVKTNNHVSNLEWCTGFENTQHSWRTGLSKGRPGEKCHFAKLSWALVGEIRALFIGGESQTKLATKYSVHQSTVSLIVRNKRWTHA